MSNDERDGAPPGSTRWRAIVDHVPHAVAVLGAVRDERGAVVDLCVEHLNRAAARSREHLPRHDAFVAACLDALRSGSAIDRCVGGHELHVEPRGDEVVATWWPARESGDALRAQLERQNAQLQAVYAAMEDGLVVFDAHGDVVLANDAEARLFGYASADELMKQDLGRFVEVFELSELDGTEVPVERWPVARVLRGERVTVELATRRKDTGQEWVTRFRGEPVRDGSGALVLAVVVSTDVTERVRREQALRASEERFRVLADSMPQLVWRASSSGVVDYYNARVREYGGLEAQGDGTWKWQPAVHPDDVAATLDAWSAAAASASDYAFEHRLRMADGSYRWHVSRAHRVRDESGVTWFGTATDIHEQKLSEKALERALATRDQLVSVVSHDLRNPLTILSAVLALLGRVVDTHPDDEARARGAECVVLVNQQVSRMEKLIAELLDVARLQAGRSLELERRPCDLVALVRELAAEHAAVAHREIELRASVPVLAGELDPSRIERVVGNLLSNAVKYSPGGGRIVVDVERAADEAIVRVSDHGIGIAPSDRERIFEWLGRGRNAAHAARGTGIGLAGARQVVEAHGGSLTVESELGVGSTFEVRLPLRTM